MSTTYARDFTLIIELVGWGKPEIIVTLVLSGVLMVAFFFVEKKVQDPAVPPRVWSIPNVIPLFFYALSVYWFLYVFELQLVEVFQVSANYLFP